MYINTHTRVCVCARARVCVCVCVCRDFPGGPVTGTCAVSAEGLGLIAGWRTDWIPYAATKSLHATTKDPTCLR